MGKKEKDNSYLDVFEFVNFLRENPTSHKIKALAEQWNVKRNQVHRWIKYAKLYGVSLEKSYGSIKIGEGKQELEKVILDRIDVEALIVAASRVKALTPFAEEALRKLEDAQYAADIPDSLFDNPILYTPLVDKYKEKHFERIVTAIRKQRVADISYENAKGETKNYHFNSYAIIVSDQHLHLVGVSHSSIDAGYNTVIRLRLDKIIDFKLFYSAKNEEVRFEKHNFKVEEYAHKEFGVFSAEGEPQTIKVQFSKEKANYIKRTKRHPTQDVKTQDDGTALWQITAPLSQDLVFWITSYGPHAKVIEPQELKEQVKQWAKGSLDANS